MRLVDRVALVTGGSRGIGRKIAFLRDRRAQESVRALILLSCMVLCLGCANFETHHKPLIWGGLTDLPRIRPLKTGRVGRDGRIEPGETLVLADIQDTGVIHHFWMTYKHDCPQSIGKLVLRAWWDGEEHPSVEVPLGDFFGVGFGQERHLKSAVMEMTPAAFDMHSALNCYFPMPFSRRAYLTLENQSEKPVEIIVWFVNYEKWPQLPHDYGRFHAQWRRENPVTRHVPYTIAEIEGEGRYVGTVMNYHILEPGAWVEGGEDFYIDGDLQPTLKGVGSEDYFGQSWGFRQEYNNLYHGTSLGPVNSKFMTAYRWHVLDPIRFKKSLRVTMRCHGWDVQDRSDDYSSVAYWYQKEPHKPFPALPPWPGRMPEFANTAR